MAQNWNPDWVVHPGEILEEELVARKWSIESFALMCGLSYQMMAGLVDGKVPLSPALAERIAMMLGTSPQLWLNLERTFREGLAAGKTWREE